MMNVAWNGLALEITVKKGRGGSEGGRTPFNTETRRVSRKDEKIHHPGVPIANK